MIFDQNCSFVFFVFFFGERQTRTRAVFVSSPSIDFSFITFVTLDIRVYEIFPRESCLFLQVSLDVSSRSINKHIDPMQHTSFIISR